MKAFISCVSCVQVGFEYKFVFVKDGSYGTLLANGTWNGIVGELIRHVGISQVGSGWLSLVGPS